MSTPSTLGARFDGLLSARFALQSKKNRVTVPSRLPPRLERCVARLSPGCEWRAYRYAQGIFFAIARASISGERSQAEAGIEVYFLDADASVFSAVLWEYDAERGWWLDAVLDLDYHCDHGWWLTALTTPERRLDARSAADSSPPLIEFGTTLAG